MIVTNAPRAHPELVEGCVSKGFDKLSLSAKKAWAA